MISLISPAKNLNLKIDENIPFASEIDFKKKTFQLVNFMRQFNPDQLSDLMKISQKLSISVFEYYLNITDDKFQIPYSKQALFQFDGDVYKSINTITLSSDDCEYAQNHLRIISGLYGLIKPMDLIQPYRLEMGTRIKYKNQNLYEFWQETITNNLNNILEEQENKVILNLSSQEYSKAIITKNISGKWINVDFKEYKNGSYKTIGIYAKRARGLMVRYIIDNKIDDISEVKKFNINDYKYSFELSTNDKLVFTR